jgi:hypothetical protein
MQTGDRNILAIDEAGFRDFLPEHLLPGPHMRHRPFATDTLDTLEVDHDQLPTRLQRLRDRLHRGLRELKVMIGIADESEVDGVGRQPHVIIRTEYGRNVARLAGPGTLMNVLKKTWTDVDRIDPSVRTCCVDEPMGVEPGTCANIRNDHARLKLAGLKDCIPRGIDFAAFDFESLQPINDLQARITKGIIDPGFNGFLLGTGTGQ